MISSKNWTELSICDHLRGVNGIVEIDFSCPDPSPDIDRSSAAVCLSFQKSRKSHRDRLRRRQSTKYKVNGTRCVQQQKTTVASIQPEFLKSHSGHLASVPLQFYEKMRKKPRDF
jgi:hypothetical protein